MFLFLQPNFFSPKTQGIPLVSFHFSSTSIFWMTYKIYVSFKFYDDFYDSSVHKGQIVFKCCGGVISIRKHDGTGRAKQRDNNVSNEINGVVFVDHFFCAQSSMVRILWSVARIHALRVQDVVWWKVWRFLEHARWDGSSDAISVAVWKS